MIVRTLMTVGVALVAASVFAQGSGVDLSKAKLRTPADTSLVLLRLRREPASLPEGNLGGKVWVDEVSLL